MVSLDRGIPDRPVHSLRLPVRPGTMHLGEPELDAIVAAEVPEDTGQSSACDGRKECWQISTGKSGFLLLQVNCLLQMWPCNYRGGKTRHAFNLIVRATRITVVMKLVPVDVDLCERKALEQQIIGDSPAIAI